MQTHVCVSIIRSKLLGTRYATYYTGKEVCVLVNRGGKIKIGKSKCHKEDKFNREIGEALAICRAMKWRKLENELLESLEKGENNG